LQGAQTGITACPDFREAKRVIPPNTIIA